jgi:D-3-phosphoglycerate dehydrogenase
MLDTLLNKPQKIAVVGDAFVSPDTMEEAVRASKIVCGEIVKAFWGEDDKQSFTRSQLNIEQNGPDAEPYAEALDRYIQDADILLTHFCPIPRRLIEKGKNLKAIFTCRGGLEHICIDAANEKNICVVNVIRNSEPVADFALGMIIALTRNIATSHHALMQGKWEKTFPNSGFMTTLSNHIIGLAGIGNIGIELACKLKALGIKTIAHDSYVSPERLKKNGLSDIKLVPSMEDLFKESDVISLHLRLTNDTEKIINKKYFSLMKPTAYFINTARGGLVDYNDLVNALKTKSIAGAALDVFNEEPVNKSSGLLDLDNVILTPHIAGTTVDAIPKSPFMLLREVDKILINGVTDRIVNFHSIVI